MVGKDSPLTMPTVTRQSQQRHDFSSHTKLEQENVVFGSKLHVHSNNNGYIFLLIKLKFSSQRRETYSTCTVHL